VTDPIAAFAYIIVTMHMTNPVAAFVYLVNIHVARRYTHGMQIHV